MITKLAVRYISFTVPTSPPNRITNLHIRRIGSFKGILDKVMGLSHESDWPEEAKTVFSSSITNTDKNFASLARRLNKKAGDCQEYYYSKFKRTQEYSRMKRALRRTVKTRTSDVELSTTLGRDN
jgi:hypothetical protein